MQMSDVVATQVGGPRQQMSLSGPVSFRRFVGVEEWSAMTPRRSSAVGVAVTAVTWVALELVHAPTPPLFATLLGAATVALTQPNPPALSARVRGAGMSIVGVAAGASITSGVLDTIAEEPVAVILGVGSTLVVSMLIGQMLRWNRDVSGTTAAFASIAGGASGVSLMAAEYGADDVTVITVQYLRVIIVLVTVPLVAPLLDATGGTATAAPVAAEPTSTAQALLFTACAIAIGLLAARLIRFPAAAILFPLLAAAGLSLSGWFGEVWVPGWVTAIGYCVVGASDGIGFSRHRLRALTRLLPLALLQTVLGIAACGLIGIGFARAVGISDLDGYLATTPGGLPAVIAVALDSGGAIGLILTMQFLRVFVALACTPLLGLWLARRGRSDADTKAV